MAKTLIIQRRQNIVLFHQPALGLLHLQRIEELNLVFTFAPRGDGSGNRASVELLRAQLAVKHRNSDAGAGAKLDTVQRQTLADCSEHLLT
nr:Uncharacterised protein [Raoultella sp. NCTC 9187]